MDVVEKTEESGSSTTMAAALDPDLTSESEPYLHDYNTIAPREFAKDRKLAEKLWVGTQ
ncbi:hypothetical protein sscle_16g109360 [Sclerotinia sclerotiorum 1980 UF-70]|uniref:Uncharacterized protein n=1 Tax=Sclerotinia sclerotiorum (strain ATCC 18683 / 1980 / Ss-1) TaxID=665079 RepID=A0A1D9QMK6_SCLS1|nr:hypothetical protein sscle_16g109360 [Sclerotinia sclerotiorum 1980 UF-70]